MQLLKQVKCCISQIGYNPHFLCVTLPVAALDSQLCSMYMRSWCTVNSAGKLASWHASNVPFTSALLHIHWAARFYCSAYSVILCVCVATSWYTRLVCMTQAARYIIWLLIQLTPLTLFFSCMHDTSCQLCWPAVYGLCNAKVSAASKFRLANAQKGLWCNTLDAMCCLKQLILCIQCSCTFNICIQFDASVEIAAQVLPCI